MTDVRPARPAEGNGDGKAGARIASTRDSFHRGGFEALQPQDAGHRSGSDALLIAAALPAGVSGRLADLGAGAGVAAFAALAMNPGIEAVLVGILPSQASLAPPGLALPANAAFRDRASVIEADVTLTGDKRAAAGLGNAAFDHVVMNPPYNSAAHRPSPDDLRSLAHSLGVGGLDPWLRTAAAILKPGGTLTMIWRTERLGDVLAGMQGRFGGVCVLPLHARAGETARRIVVRAVRGSRAPFAIAPGVVLHEADGSQTALADALLNGRARLDFPG